MSIADVHESLDRGVGIRSTGAPPSSPVVGADSVWDKVLDVNGRGVFVGSREAAKRMTAAGRGGVIVNIVSTAGFKGVAPGLAAYVSSKHAVRGLTKQTALELAPQGIRVLGVAPTYCVTEGKYPRGFAKSVSSKQHKRNTGDAQQPPGAGRRSRRCCPRSSVLCFGYVDLHDRQHASRRRR